MRPCLSPRPLSFLFLTVLLLVAPALLAEDHSVRVFSNGFSPQVLTIQAGDTVTWTNEGGLHNVESNDPDGVFRCANGCDDTGGNGAASSALWSFTRTFNDPGEIDYVCIVHAGVGMVGTLIVEGGGGNPGQLSFDTATLSVGEGGTATFSVTRSGGTDGAVSVDYATSDGSAAAGADYTAASGTLNWADGQGGSQSFDVATTQDSDVESNETVNATLSNVGGGATLGTSSATLTIQDDDEEGGESSPGTISLATSAVQVSEGSGSASIAVSRSGGSDGSVGVSFETASGTAQDGADFVGQAGELSWPDGDSSDRSIDIELIDDGAEEDSETLNVMISNPTGGADLGSPTAATVTLTDNDQPLEACVADSDTLCLQDDGRFQVEVTWQTPDGTAGAGQAFEIGQEDSGLFYFFTESNIELLVKVLDACELAGFNTYWVFFAATTDLQFELTVTDTASGTQRVYTNEQGNPANAVTDTFAFETCP